MTNVKTKGKIKRLNLELNAQAAANLDELCARGNIDSYTQAVQQGLSLLHYLLEERDKGGEFFIERKDGSKKAVALIFT